MTANLKLLMMLAMAVSASWLRADETSLSQQYLAVYVKINQAEQAERKGDYKGAVDAFTTCYQQLADFQKTDPDWQTALILHRMADCKAKILELTPKIPPAPQMAIAGGAAGQTNVVPATAGPAPDTIFVTTRMRPHNIFPWKEGIPAGQFWIGEKDGKGSAWAAQWVRENGGPDSPTDRNGYASGSHASGLSPFYVALPFDDLAHPNLAQKWLPRGWARSPKDGKPVSACKDRWVEIKNGRGDVCFAQWEDAGPEATDKAEYVFGGGTPGEAGEPGIDLSPAVFEYLGLGPGGQGQTVSWRFVDDAEVRPGAWMKLDEQAVIYMALHHEPK
jgi:hypothetical protein